MSKEVQTRNLEAAFWRSVLVTALAMATASCGNSAGTEKPASEGGKEPVVVATYFHNTIRCVSCLEIERTAHEAVLECCASELESGALRWRAVNMELPENEHYAVQYDLTEPSLVLVRREGGRQTAWKNLSKVWTLVQDPQVLRRYVAGEVAGFLHPPQAGSLGSTGSSAGPATTPARE